MKTFDFTNPASWSFEAIVWLYSPMNEDYADMIAEMMDYMTEANVGSAHGDVDSWDYETAHKLATPGSRFDTKGTCDHCGAHFHYGAAYKNADGDVAIVGNICASTKLNLTAHEYADAKLRTRVKAARNKIAGDKAMVKLAPNRRAALNTDHYICRDMKSRFRKWHSMSVKAWALAKKLAKEDADRTAAREAEKATMAPIPSELTDGRHTFTGTIKGLRTDDTPYGYATKMVFMDDRGFKLWGTVPSALFDAVDGDLRDARVRFDAAIEISDDDEYFGFFKRPTKAAALDATTEETA